MTFHEFAATCYDLESTRSRLGKIARVADYLRRLAADEIRCGVAFLSGRPFPVSDPRTLDVGPGALRHAYETPEIESSLGHISLGDVAATFARIAAAEGKGSRSAKYAALRQLVEMTPGRDRAILMRLLHNELRIGVHDGLILEAIAAATGAPVNSVRRAALFVSDLAEVASIGLTRGGAALDHVDVQLFVPLLPMLSQLSEDLEQVIAVHGGRTALEFKYDGARVQIHKRGGEVRIWSRRLTEVTASLPEISRIARTEIGGGSFILDGEVVAVGASGRPYPFQELMRRFRRVHEIESAATDIPLVLYLFDCLMLDQVSFIDEPYSRRWETLSAITAEKHLAQRLVTSDIAAAEKFMNESLASGHEGLMAKALDSPYAPGNRGKLWFKIKPAENVDCIIIAADRGSGRRQGWLSNYHLAVADGAGGFAPVGKTFKGLTDRQFAEMTARLEYLRVADDGYTVTVRPEVVVEVAYNEIQRSPQYSSGYALRFARIKRIREDKGVADITSLAELNALYERQFIAKSRRDQ